ncbi:MAG: glycosyltransferase family 2 protein [Alphaproteobacteria bacterium]|nr:glycosyltransferase family 2 protein [Alphaproteobacteria bacterium]
MTCPILISIVVPTHNEELNVQELHKRITAVFKDLERFNFELIFVDDSLDNTPGIIVDMHSRDERVKLVRLVRSFGQSIAIAAGLARCQGEAAIIMDADLQDPPEVIPQLINQWVAGNKLVYVERGSFSNSFIYRKCAKLFYWSLSRVTSIRIPVDAGEFRLLDRKLIDFMNGLTEQSRFIRGLTVWPGFKSAKVTIERAPRLQGATNYNWNRSALVAIDGFVSFSVAPLRIATLLGILGTLLTCLMTIGYVIAWLFVPGIFGVGWLSLFVAVVAIGSLNLFCLGVIGEYVGRIFVEAQNRPLYLVDHEIGFGKETL